MAKRASDWKEVAAKKARLEETAEPQAAAHAEPQAEFHAESHAAAQLDPQLDAQLESHAASYAKTLQLARAGRNMFITGPAGCGKSYSLRGVYDELRQFKRVAVTASTGSAAHNLGLGASTMQSMFGFSEQAKNPKASRLWAEYDVLIIDECSMIGPKLFALIDRLAKEARRSGEPLGGMQLILVGDFLQLPPVADKEEDKDAPTYIFETPLWHLLHLAVVSLKTPFRQRDPRFSSMLNRFRVGEPTAQDIEMLEANVPDPNLGPLVSLYSKNPEVDYNNNKELQLLPKPEYRWTPTITPEGKPFKDQIKKIQADYKPVVIRVGAPVMLTANLSQEFGLVNGARGVVVDVKDNCPVVEVASGRFAICPRQQVHELFGGTVTVLYMPVALAWAMSIHKSQGQSLDRVSVSCHGAFCPGQIYVGLSRATSLAGLDVKGLKKEFRSVGVCKKTVQFYQDIAKIK
jgi:ATP-dependent DNA helicase PIF1